MNSPVRQPPYSITGSLSKAVEAELEDLLQQARKGKIIGLAYVTHPTSGGIDAGAAGSLGRDDLKAAGALFNAAMAATR